MEKETLGLLSLFVVSILLFLPVQTVFASNQNLTNDLYVAVSSYYGASGCSSLTLYGNTLVRCTQHVSPNIADVSIVVTGTGVSHTSIFGIKENRDGVFTISEGNNKINVTRGEVAKLDPSVSYSFSACGDCTGFRGSGGGSTGSCGQTWSSSSSISGNTYSLSWSGPGIALDPDAFCLVPYGWIGTSWTVSDNFGFYNSGFGTYSSSTSFFYPYYYPGNPYVSVDVDWAYAIIII
jgi:hypothetical protein